MRARGMVGVVACRRRPRTTIPGEGSARPRDLVERDFRAPASNQLWLTDITYVELAGGGFCYTAFVTDAFSRAIVGWQVLDTLKTELALDALDMALWSRKDRLSTALVHHGDRGVQYTAIRYGQRLIEAGIERSVGRKGDSYDNALAESINALYKKELITRHGRASRGDPQPDTCGGPCSSRRRCPCHRRWGCRRYLSCRSRRGMTRGCWAGLATPHFRRV